MKYTAFTFILYFILLAVLPCQDKDAMFANSSHMTVRKGQVQDNCNGQETCPPFCTCSCCSTARNLTTNSITIIFFKVPDRQYPDGKILPVQEQPIAIWQPPQIA